MIRLRGHHLICLHFFHGEGYSSEFISNLERTVSSIKREGVEVCEGADDICAACPSLKKNMCVHSEYADAEVREMDRLATTLLGAHVGERMSWKGIESRLPDIFGRWLETCCSGCDWKSACEKDAEWRRLKGSL